MLVAAAAGAGPAASSATGPTREPAATARTALRVDQHLARDRMRASSNNVPPPRRDELSSRSAWPAQPPVRSAPVIRPMTCGRKVAAASLAHLANDTDQPS